MLGAAVYTLIADNAATLPAFTGRLMHAAFFSAIDKISPELATCLHDATQMKSFTLSALKLPPKDRHKSAASIKRLSTLAGMEAKWRVTGLNELILQAMAAIAPGTAITIGRTKWKVARIALGPDDDRQAGAIEEEQLIAECLAVSPNELTLRFLSPTCFRVYDKDFPWPEPALIFGSLADRWQGAGLPAVIDPATVRNIASAIRPTDWRGEAKKIYFGPSRGITAFTGTFNYDLSALSLKERQVLLLFARFAEFSGVGRLTAQGFGQTSVNYRLAAKKHRVLPPKAKKSPPPHKKINPHILPLP